MRLERRSIRAISVRCHHTVRLAREVLFARVMKNGSVSNHGLGALLRANALAHLLTADEEATLIRRARAGDARAADRLTRAHIRFVLAIAGEFRCYGAPFDELASEGMLGFMEALRRFEPDRGPRLAGYAALWIRALLRRYTLNNRRIVRPPSSRAARRVIGRGGQARRVLAQRLGHEPDAEALARELGVKASDVEEISDVMSKRDVVYDAPGVVGAYEAPSPSPSPELLVADQEIARRRAAAIERALVLLSPRERLVVSQRSLEDSPRKLEDIGADLGVSRERVRQIQNDAFAKMRVRLALANVA
jgi:RNA polymerase sigma-32 factor